MPTLENAIKVSIVRDYLSARIEPFSRKNLIEMFGVDGPRLSRTIFSNDANARVPNTLLARLLPAPFEDIEGLLERVTLAERDTELHEDCSYRLKACMLIKSLRDGERFVSIGIQEPFELNDAPLSAVIRRGAERGVHFHYLLGEDRAALNENYSNEASSFQYRYGLTDLKSRIDNWGRYVGREAELKPMAFDVTGELTNASAYLFSYFQRLILIQRHNRENSELWIECAQPNSMVDEPVLIRLADDKIEAVLNAIPSVAGLPKWHSQDHVATDSGVDLKDPMWEIPPFLIQLVLEKWRASNPKFKEMPWEKLIGEDHVGTTVDAEDLIRLRKQRPITRQTLAAITYRLYRPSDKLPKNFLESDAPSPHITEFLGRLVKEFAALIKDGPIRVLSGTPPGGVSEYAQYAIERIDRLGPGDHCYMVTTQTPAEYNRGNGILTSIRNAVAQGVGIHYLVPSDDGEVIKSNSLPGSLVLQDEIASMRTELLRVLPSEDLFRVVPTDATDPFYSLFTQFVLVADANGPKFAHAIINSGDEDDRCVIELSRQRMKLLHAWVTARAGPVPTAKKAKASKSA